MYKKILICLDNSDYSLAGADIGLKVAAATGASATGCHVYAARLHNERFRQMEGGLSEEYQKEDKLKDQREVHDTLITKGLRIISDAYTDVFRAKAAALGLTPVCVNREGKNFEEIVKEAYEGGYELVILGALGLGKTDFSVIGSVAERVARRANSDVLIVRDTFFRPSGKILVAIDGSPLAFGGLVTAIKLSKIFNLQIEAVSVFDPDYHRSAFRSIAGVLSEEAGKLFRFKEQERLHEEVIDKGLAKIYQDYLDTAAGIADKQGVRLTARLLSGKAPDEIIKYVKDTSPFILITGKTGSHSTDSLDIGSVTERCLRHAASSVLVSNYPFVPEKLTLGAVEWDDAAKEVLSKIPSFARGIVKSMAEEAARKEGVKVITVAFMRAVRSRMEG